MTVDGMAMHAAWRGCGHCHLGRLGACDSGTACGKEGDPSVRGAVVFTFPHLIAMTRHEEV